MKCPACRHQLSPITADKFQLWGCRTFCGGLWMTGKLFRNIRQADASTLTELLEVNLSPGSMAGAQDKRTCPSCNGIAMMRHRAKPDSAVEVDECGSCGGIWLDGNELAQIFGLPVILESAVNTPNANELSHGDEELEHLQGNVSHDVAYDLLLEPKMQWFTDIRDIL